MTDLEKIIRLADAISLPSALIIVLVTGFKGWWVWGWAYDALRRDRDAKTREIEQWHKLALETTRAAQRAARLAAKLASQRSV